MPVWHDATRQWVKDGKLVLLGVTQEQHPERCRLFAQWKQFDWPILHDPINVLESSAVPIVLAIDEHGIVRSTRPNPKTFEDDFLKRVYADDASNKPHRLGPIHPPKFEELTAQAAVAKSAIAWRNSGDAMTLWGSERDIVRAVDDYRSATMANPKDGAAWFRLGVSLRRRSESNTRESDDFQKAVEAWGTALDLDPNQYIWRRRIQQYGPRLDKPYPFYDWIGEAEADIRKRGMVPVALPFRPDGSEIAKPAKTFEIREAVPKNPDPDGKVNRDVGSVVVEIVTVPPTVKPGQSVRVHLTYRLVPKTTDLWNNEAEPLKVWIDPPKGVTVSDRLIESDKPTTAKSTESRTVGFEVQISKDARGTVVVPIFGLYHVCDDAQGQCRYLRLDTKVDVKVK